MNREFSCDHHKLIRSSKTAYYIIVISQIDDIYYVVLRRGKIGGHFPKSPFFSGTPILSNTGYVTLDEAFKSADEKIEQKKAQSGNRKYVDLLPDEDLVEIEVGGRKVVRLITREMANI